MDGIAVGSGAYVDSAGIVQSLSAHSIHLELDCCRPVLCQGNSNHSAQLLLVIKQLHWQESQELRVIVGEIDEYYSRHQLLEAIRCELETPIATIDIKLFRLENEADFQGFLFSYRQAQYSIQMKIITAIGELVDFW